MGSDGYTNKEKNGLYSIQFYYTDYAGNKKRKRKCNFKTIREAKAWRDEFIRKEQSDIGMTFDSFYESYKGDIYHELRNSTIGTKTHIIELHILPFFGERKMSDITARDIKQWQKQIKENNDFSEAYLWSINTQLNAMFNHAVRFYKLHSNPCLVAGFMGKSKSGNISVWSLEEMKLFLDAFEDEPEVYYAFYFLYSTGIRLGELLALNIGDINFEEKYVDIKKSLNRVAKEDIISKPKTESSIRKVYLSDAVLDKMKTYTGMLYGRTKKDRLFGVTKSNLEKKIKEGASKAGLEPIRVHDLRHSHASLLIANHADIATISKRLGHEKITTTLNIYGHMFEANARKVADSINEGLDF